MSVTPCQGQSYSNSAMLIWHIIDAVMFVCENSSVSARPVIRVWGRKRTWLKAQRQNTTVLSLACISLCLVERERINRLSSIYPLSLHRIDSTVPDAKARQQTPGVWCLSCSWLEFRYVRSRLSTYLVLVERRAREMLSLLAAFLSGTLSSYGLCSNKYVEYGFGGKKRFD